MFRGIYHWVCSVLERHTAPLTRLQAWKLKCLPLEGLVMEPDKKSLSTGTSPTFMYAFLDGRYICTAYGDRVDAPRRAMKSPEVRGIVAKIESCYLPARQLAQPEDSLEIDPDHYELTRMQLLRLRSFPDEDITFAQEKQGCLEVFYKGKKLGTAHGDEFVVAEGGIRHVCEKIVFEKIENWYKPTSLYESDDMHDAD